MTWPIAFIVVLVIAALVPIIFGLNCWTGLIAIVVMALLLDPVFIWMETKSLQNEQK